MCPGAYRQIITGIIGIGAVLEAFFRRFIHQYKDAHDPEVPKGRFDSANSDHCPVVLSGAQLQICCS